MTVRGPIIAAAMASLLSSCDEAPKPDAAPPAQREQRATSLPRPAQYQPPALEPYRNGKRLAARIAQAITTYPTGSSAERVAARTPGARNDPTLPETIAPLVAERAASAGTVGYVQLSGVTGRSLGAMVITRQSLLRAGTRPRTVTRVIDVRLRRTTGRWTLDRVGSIGGLPARRPARLSHEARQVLDHDNISLTDSARWDIYRGDVDRGLLRALMGAAEARTITVGALRSGHPSRVWASDRASAHRFGYAADIYAVDGRLVLRQRTGASPARRLAAELIAGGAEQVGSPWPLPPGGRRAFSDAVHQDHIHLQQTARPATAP